MGALRVMTESHFVSCQESRFGIYLKVDIATSKPSVAISTFESLPERVRISVQRGRLESWSDPSDHTWEYRSHFGSRYKLGCCGHASLFGRGSNPPARALGK